MRLTWKLASVCLLLFLAGLWWPASAHAQEPDFSGKTHILNGQTHLLRSDDIAWAYAQNASSAPYTNLLSANFVLMNDSAISDRQSLTTTSVTTAVLNPTVQVAVGRLYDLPNDLAAVLAIEAPAPGQPEFMQWTATLYDRLADRVLYQVVGVTEDPSAAPTLAVMADFTGDGFDDLVVGFGGADGMLIAIIQAANPRAWADGLRLGPIYPAAIPVAAFAIRQASSDHRSAQWTQR